MAGQRSSTTEVLNFRPTHAPVKHFSLNIVYQQPREGGSILWTMRSNGTVSPLLAHTREMKTFSWLLVAGYSPQWGSREMRRKLDRSCSDFRSDQGGSQFVDGVASRDSTAMN
jgi:hypothetical protein